MTGTRQEILETLRTGTSPFDVIVVGGGITGAGVAREAAGSGMRTLLVEQKDFAWGTSSRSSKMVHGGLRYLASGQYRLTRDAVRERQRLMAEAPGLIQPLRFIMPHFRRQFPGPKVFQTLLAGYDRIAGFRSRQRLSRAEAVQWVPGLTTENLTGASVFLDAVTDDARLVQRVIAEARRDGAVCLNYTKAMEIRRTDGKVSGVRLKPEDNDTAFDLPCPLIINATGAWAGQLQATSTDNEPLSIRPLRGSHLVLPWSRLPVSCSVSLLHPDDKRPVFAFPWAGTTVLGTTDLDHTADLDAEPCISDLEVDYLLEITNRLFPARHIARQDIVSSWSGIRPIVSDGTGKNPSKEKREHDLRIDQGLVSVSGGKLTTFRLIAREALAMGLSDNNRELRDERLPVFGPESQMARPEALEHLTWQRLKGFYGSELENMLECGPLRKITTEGTTTDLLWAELYWACRHEDVRHLDDLLLRRTRLGLTVPNAAQAVLPEVKEHCQPILGWNDARWEEEEKRYLDIWTRAYSLPQKEPANGGK